jgi:ubiquinone/menaquinone biosynthesis C-methylase UbiE
MISVDVGCGYRKDIHYPNMRCNIFLEPFLDNPKADITPYLKQHGHLIMSSAEYLPFKKDSIDKLFIRAVIEHLHDPIKALSDIHYSVKKYGYIEVIIPIITSHFKHYLVNMFIAFPFGVYDVIKCMMRMMNHYHDKGLSHISNLKPEVILSLFKMNGVIKPIYYRHKWFYGLWGQVIKKYLTNGGEPIHDIQGIYKIKIWNT